MNKYYGSKIKKHFDKVAKNYDFYKKKNAFYYENLKKLLGGLIPQKSTVLEIGCGTGELLASLNPKVGYGFDISDKMIELAKSKYKTKKNLHFSTDLSPFLNHKSIIFNHVFMSDVIEHLEDPEKTFRDIAGLMGPETIFVNTMANPLWEPFLMIAEKLGLKMPEGPHRRITNYELRIMIETAGMKIIKHDYKLLVPIKIPLITDFANKYLEKPLKKLAFIEYIIVVKA